MSLSENPCANNSNFRLFIAFLIPQIQYFDYKLIRQDEREIGEQIFKYKNITFSDTLKFNDNFDQTDKNLSQL